jgi:membrane-associated protease RseP (regulator of RpoE activity)
MPGPLSVALLILAAHAICVAVHISTMAVVGWRLGATVKEVSLFFSPVVIRFRYRGVNYQLGILPLGGSVRFKDDQDKPKGSEELLFAADMEVPGLSDLHPLKRAAIPAAGCAALIVLGALCLGPWASVRSLGRGFLQLMPAAPWTPAWVPGGRALANRFVSLFRGGPFRVALGVLAAKQAAFNLLPLPPLNGGVIVISLAGWKKRLPEMAEIMANYVGIFFAILLTGYWIIRLAEALRLVPW